MRKQFVAICVQDHYRGVWNTRYLVAAGVVYDVPKMRSCLLVDWHIMIGIFYVNRYGREIGTSMVFLKTNRSLYCEQAVFNGTSQSSFR